VSHPGSPLQIPENEGWHKNALDATLPTMNSHTVIAPTLQSRSEATAYELLGGSISVRVRSEDTAGRFGLIEQVVPPGFPGPALHVHPDFEETFYVLGGTLIMRVGDDSHEAGAGTVAVIPRGTPHTFANPSDEPAHTLVLVTPGGFERYFEALAAAVIEAGGFPPSEQLVALGVEHGSVPA
jgi:quercetin dioxygenase-like cupin family protein